MKTEKLSIIPNFYIEIYYSSLRAGPVESGRSVTGLGDGGKSVSVWGEVAGPSGGRDRLAYPAPRGAPYNYIGPCM